MLYSYEQDGEDAFYYKNGSGEKTRISDEDFQTAVHHQDFKEYDLPWKPISSLMQDDASGNVTETNNTTETRINLVDSFTPDQQRTVNIFLSNFAESNFFHEYPSATEDELFHFAYEHCKLNGYTRYIEELENNQCRLSADVVDERLMRFFGRTIPHESRDVFEYRDGFYYFPAMSGEFHGYLAIVDAMYRNEDGTYDVEFTEYAVYDEYNYNISDYYVTSPQDVLNYPELEVVSHGTAILRDYTKRDGSASYQLIQFNVKSE